MVAMFQKHTGDVLMRALVKSMNSILIEILGNNGMAISTSGEEISWEKKGKNKAVMSYAVTQNHDKPDFTPRSRSASYAPNRFLKSSSRVTSVRQNR